MKKEKQYVESLEELVYENRNKEYGSYQIRRKYRKYITISTIISLFLLGLIVAYPLIKSYLDQENLKKKTQNNIEVDMKNIDTPPPPPPPPPPPTNEVVNQTKFVVPEATKDSSKVTHVALVIDVPVNTAPPPEPVAAQVAVVETPKETNEVFTIVEEMPTFPDGDVGVYLSKNIKYPVVAQENGIQGRVICQFVVNKDGSIVDVQVVRGVDPSLDKEAVRVIQGMPRWTPGKQRNQAVRVKYTLPVNFKLQ